MNKVEFDRFADAYDDQHRQNIALTGEGPEYFAEYKIKKLRQAADRLKISAKRICDFGSGIGNSIPYFRQYFPEASLAAADVSERSLAISQARFPGTERHLLIEDHHIAEPAGAFDVIFSACVFHHISHEEHVTWLKELYRVTRSGGLIAVAEHNPLNPLTVRAVNTCPFDENARLIGANRMIERLREASWSSPTIEYNLFFPRQLAWLRPLEPHLAWLPLGAQYMALARKP